MGGLSDAWRVVASALATVMMATAVFVAGSPSAVSDAPRSEVQTPFDVEMRREFRDGDLALTVTQTVCRPASFTTGQSVGRHTRVHVSLRVINRGATVRGFDLRAQLLIDSFGGGHRPWELSRSAYGAVSDSIVRVAGGYETSMVVIFGVPEYAQPSVIEVHDSWLSRVVRVKVSCSDR